MALEANDTFHGHIRPILGHCLGCDRLRGERVVGIRILVSPAIVVGLCSTLLLLYFSYTKALLQGCLISQVGGGFRFFPNFPLNPPKNPPIFISSGSLISQRTMSFSLS